MLRQASEDIQRVLQGLGGAVVGIGRRGPLGSGVVIDTGRVLTNAHNVRSDRATVTLQDGTSIVGEVVGADLDRDLAVIEVETNGIEPAAWADSDGVSIGAPVVALANPGGRGLRVTAGFVSGTERRFRGPRGRRIGGALEHTAPLLPGSSGGPLADLDGRLMGVNTHRLGDGFYLALPAADIRAGIDSLLAGEEPKPVRLGVAVVPGFVSRKMRSAVGLPEAAGVLVRGVEDGSPAAAAGIKAGDLITRIGGQPVADIDDLYAALDGTARGAEFTVGVLRGTDEIELTAMVQAA